LAQSEVFGGFPAEGHLGGRQELLLLTSIFLVHACGFIRWQRKNKNPAPRKIRVVVAGSGVICRETKFQFAW
jgi:hypothetical protein